TQRPVETLGPDRATGADRLCLHHLLKCRPGVGDGIEELRIGPPTGGIVGPVLVLVSGVASDAPGNAEYLVSHSASSRFELVPATLLQLVVLHTVDPNPC